MKPKSVIIDDYDAYLRSRSRPYIELRVNEEGRTLFDLQDEKEEWDYEPEVPDFEGVIGEEKSSEIMGILPSMFVEFAVRMPDKKNNTYVPFSFEGRNYLRQIYDTPSKRTLLKCGRQVEKSTLLGNKLLSYACIVQALNCLYVSPTNQQTKVFSQDRLKEPVETSEYLKSWTTTKLSDNVFLKKFINRSQVTLRYCYMSADRCRGIPADVICFDKHAQVLTKNGWKLISSISESDEIADVDNRGVVEWNKPFNIFSRKHVGDMVAFNHSKMHIRVTGDHNMVANFKVKPGLAKEDAYVFSKAIDLARTNTMGFKMTCGAEWEGTTPQYITLKGIPTGHGRNRRDLKLLSSEFALLVGWYISEGHIQRYNNKKGLLPVISQNSNRHLKEIVDTVKSLGLSFRIHKDPRSDVHHVVINSLILGHFFSKLGKSRDKYIPRDFFESPKLLSNILRGIYLGDACYHQVEDWWEGTLRTRSKQLAEDVQEAWLRLRRPAVIHTRSFVPAHQNNPNYDNIAPEPMYEVCSYKRDYFVFWRSEFETKNRVTVEQVADEDVYCFTVKNHRPVVKGDFGSQPVITGQCIDELQDIMTDNIPIIEQCASHSPYKIYMYSGTPKSLDNTIEYYWTEFSTQNEWAVPCHRHSIMAGGGKLSNVYWNILDETNIGKTSLICDRCKHQINPGDERAMWVAMNPGIIHRIPKPYEGFRIPQIMVPWVPWEEIIQNQMTYPRGKFHNEVLGMSYDSGTRPLTRKDVMDNCDPNIRLDTEFQEKIKSHLAGTYPIYAGIDWGTGEQTYTVLSLGTYLQDRFTIFYIHRFEGPESEPDYMMDAVNREIDLWQVRRAGCDYGGGFWTNSKLLNRFGWERVVKYQYSTSSAKVKWDDGLKRYMVNRTEVMSDIFNAIKRRTVFRFPAWEQFQNPFGNDMLNIFSEFNEQRRENVYKKSPSSTDDAFHSILLCFLASMIDRPRPDVIAPMRDHRSEAVAQEEVLF